MAKIIFEFPTKEAAERWLTAYHSQGGDQTIYDGVTCEGDEWVEPKITEED